MSGARDERATVYVRGNMAAVGSSRSTQRLYCSRQRCCAMLYPWCRKRLYNGGRRGRRPRLQHEFALPLRPINRRAGVVRWREPLGRLTLTLLRSRRLFTAHGDVETRKTCLTHCTHFR